MKHTKADKHRRAKAIGVAAAALVVGMGLLVLSRLVAVPADEGEAAATTAATAPASAPAATETQPAPDGSGGRVPPADPKAVAGQRMGSLLLLFSLMCFAVALISVGWIVYDIRRARPAWMRQTKYPIHQRPRK